MTDPELRVFAIGAFGIDVAQRLGPRSRVVGGLADAFAHRPDWVVTIFDGERRSTLLEADKLAHDQRAPWLPIVVEHPYLRVGPSIVPGSDGACYRCFAARLRQSSSDEDGLNRALHAAYEDETAKPAGHTPAHAALAAALARAMIARVAATFMPSAPDPWASPGLVLRADLLRCEIASSLAVGLQGCPRCDVVDAAARAASFRGELEQVLR